MTELVAAFITAMVSLVVGLLAHNRSMRVQKAEEKANIDNSTNERIKFITEGYESLLERLREEVERLAQLREVDQKTFDRREADFKGYIAELEKQLEKEKQERVRLQYRVELLEQEISKVERRKDILDDDETSSSGLRSSD